MDLIDASGWNTYEGKITDPRSGNRGRDFKVMSGLLDKQKINLKKAMGEGERSH